MRGYTTIEMIVVIAIIAIISVIILFKVSGLQQNQILNGSVTGILSVINEAHSNTLSSKNDSEYGVHFESSEATLFKGQVYSAISPDNVVYTIDDDLEIVDITLIGSVVDIVFQRLTGEVDAYGTITIRVKNDTSKSRIIGIEQSGLSGINL